MILDPMSPTSCSARLAHRADGESGVRAGGHALEWRLPPSATHGEVTRCGCHTPPHGPVYDGVTKDDRLLMRPRCTGARAGCQPGRGGGPSPCRCICSWSSDVLRGRTVARLRFGCPLPDHSRQIFLDCGEVFVEAEPPQRVRLRGRSHVSRNSVSCQSKLKWQYMHQSVGM